MDFRFPDFQIGQAYRWGFASGGVFQPGKPQHLTGKVLPGNRATVAYQGTGHSNQVHCAYQAPDRGLNLKNDMTKSRKKTSKTNNVKAGREITVWRTYFPPNFTTPLRQVDFEALCRDYLPQSGLPKSQISSEITDCKCHVEILLRSYYSAE